MYQLLIAAVCAALLSFTAKASGTNDSLELYKSKIVSSYHNHRTLDAYRTFMAMKQMPDYRYDSTTAKMVVVSGIRLLQSRNAEIDPAVLLDLLQPLIEQDKRWLHFRADLYAALAKSTNDITKPDQYMNLKQADMVEYDNHYRPYEYNVLVP